MIVVWLLPLMLLAGAEDETEARQLIDARVAEIVQRLGADEYVVRERTQQEMAMLPAALMPTVSRLYHQSEDAEVRMRLRLYAHAYFEEHILPKYEQYRRPGFLGIMQQERMLDNGQGAVEVLQVLPGTAAENAGLRAGDVITHVDGKPLPANGATTTLTSYIQSRQAGGKIVCTVARNGGEDKKITATLGGLPDEHLNATAQEQIRQGIQNLREQWWQEGFLVGSLDFQDTPNDEND